MRNLVTTVQRLLAIVGKELVEVIRRPGALASLVFGPFLIMAVFGLGYDGFRRPLDTIVVVPPGSTIPTDVESYQTIAGPGFNVIAVLPDVPTAEARLAAGEADVVVVTPPDAAETFSAGKQSVIEVLIDTVDPIRMSYASSLATILSGAVNQAIIRRAVEEGQGLAVANGRPDAQAIPADVVAAPTRAELRDIAPTEPRVLAYYGPAVLALILQHLAISLVALSLVRERTSGVIELFRVGPINAWEVLGGKVIAFLLLGGLIGTLTIALLVVGFGIPLLGDPASLALAVGLLLLASLGIGLLVAVISDSERQAVQICLLLLLASVFFSGFIIAISEFSEPVRMLAYALPVTHGIRLFQDIMLRGTTTQMWQFAALGVIATVTLFAAWIGLRRGMTRA
ncbi:MAG TPA: ABC transporter permease [Candidatus Limnocylindrales bacterium]